MKLTALTGDMTSDLTIADWSTFLRMPDSIPILGTTATANNRVVNDVRAGLVI